jgi:hypothetical protein
MDHCGGRVCLATRVGGDPGAVCFCGCDACRAAMLEAERLRAARDEDAARRRREEAQRRGGR